MLRKNRFSWLYLGLAPLIFITASCSDSSTEQKTEGTPSRIFLQQVSFDSAMVKWRGEPDELWYGTDPKELNQMVKSSVETQHKIARIEGLEADSSIFLCVSKNRVCGDINVI